MRRVSSVYISLTLLASLGLGLYALLLSQLPPIEAQLASALRYELREIAQNSAVEIETLYSKRVKRFAKQLTKELTEQPYSGLIDEVLILSPDSLQQMWSPRAFPCEENLDPSYSSSAFAGWITNNISNRYDHWGERSSSYWSNTLDSTLVFSRLGSAFSSSQRFVCIPSFSGDRLEFFWCFLLSQDGLKRNILPLYFEQYFQTQSSDKGIQKAYLNLRVRNERNQLVYNEPLLAKGKMEHSLPANKGLPFLDGYTLEIGFWGQDSSAIAASVHRRNQWILHGVLLVFLAALYYVFRTHRKSRRLDQLKTDFITNISHELKTPLTNIKLVGETLKAGRIKQISEAQKQGETIYQQSLYLEERLNNMLNFSALVEQNKSEKLSLQNIEDAWQLLSTRAAEMCQIRERELQIKGLAKGISKISTTLLWEALEILIDNAIKYSEPQSTIILESEKKANHWEISLRDQGIGISTVDQKIVFDKFVRLANPDTQTVSGYGIGLAIAKQIIALHAGQIKLSSTLNKGSRFSIQIPLHT